MFVCVCAHIYIYIFTFQSRTNMDEKGVTCLMFRWAPRMARRCVNL